MTMCDEDIDRQVLAAAPGLGSITLCPCGTISLHVGGVSIRMEITAFARAAEMCRVAMASLELQAQALQSAATKKQSNMTH
jgi:hypothetical protein